MLAFARGATGGASPCPNAKLAEQSGTSNTDSASAQVIATGGTATVLYGKVNGSTTTRSPAISR